MLAFALYTLDVTPFLRDGENTVSPVLLSGRSHFPIKEVDMFRTIRSHGLIITILFFSELNFNSYTSL